MKIAIAIATAGRPLILSDLVKFLHRQTRRADELLICPAREHDIDLNCLASYPGPARVVHGHVGTSCQRNTLMKESDADVMIFFDDDFLPADDYLAEIEQLFLTHHEVIIATGTVLADGILGPGFDFMQGVHALSEADADAGPERLMPTYNGYGCNMAVRMAVVREQRISFDEHLPLYAWLEDVDFSRQLAPHGAIVRSNRLRGVHLGTKKSGRSPGKRLGYSQVANPLYLARKGTMDWGRALSQISKNIAANAVRSIRHPEPWVDRKGRLAGNAMALLDILRFRMDPMRILNL